ncbi:MAG: helix-turn-helix domain-containing protein [Candidatus Methanoperedens sp.]|nr:helix-turn-helix domain-containing protein [Candidatus Methanoperedens sp.]
MDHLPPSAKLVFKVLESNGFLTQKDIAKYTYLPARTVRYALSRLKEEKVLQERFYFQDARQSLYGLNGIVPGVMP